MPKAALLGAYLESEETRFGEREIRALYESALRAARAEGNPQNRRESRSIGKRRKFRAPR
jgi:hypothetical protein